MRSSGSPRRSNRRGLELAVIESIPVHEDIKLGRPTRDRLIAQYCESVRHMGECGVRVLCYNFMPVFDWTRTDLALVARRWLDGARVRRRARSHASTSRAAPAICPDGRRPIRRRELAALLAAYRDVSTEQLWENLAYFLERVVPVAESAGVKMAIHPDDPPWPIFGLPRIITSGAGARAARESRGQSRERRHVLYRLVRRRSGE